jgi:hypothetical protein
LTDDRFPAFSETVSGDDNFTLEEDFACSTNRADYGEDGKYSYTVTNEGKLVVDETLTDDASVTVNCEASFVDIYKTTNGLPADPDPDKEIAFALYGYASQPPDVDPKLRDDAAILETTSTANVGANLSFQTALIPGDTYSICEYPVPAGYTFEISVNGGNVLTFAGPPGETNPTGEIQCFDFIAPEPPDPATVQFNVENSFPGGAPRTPGYWKNWNTCSGGNQAETAAKLGGVEEGVFLLNDLLPQTIGDLTIDTCEDGVLILSAQDLTKGKNKANDAAYTLARALLAARLNQGAGACVPLPFDPPLVYEYNGETLTFTYFEEVLTAADGVLSQVGFDGTGDYLGPKNKKDKDLAAYALWLYEIIDDYNNSEICSGDPSH